MSGATLRLLQEADEEIRKLPRIVKGAIYDFQHKFRENPDAPGLRLKQLKGEGRLFSARVNVEYRALLLHIDRRNYVLVAVRHRKDVYANLDRYEYRINQVTGAIEFMDMVSVQAASGAAEPAPVPAPA
ncbi:type II toxin-antitoxin system RelE/ParE family toxin, partial [Actinomadura adrarensis]